MQCIRTKAVPCTNHKPARIIVSAPAGRKIFSRHIIEEFYESQGQKAKAGDYDKHLHMHAALWFARLIGWHHHKKLIGAMLNCDEGAFYFIDDTITGDI